MFVSRKSRASVRRLPSAVPRVRCRCRIVSLLSELKILGPLPCVSKALQQLKRLRRWLPRASDRVRNFSRALTGRFQSNTPTFCSFFLLNDTAALRNLEGILRLNFLPFHLLSHYLGRFQLDRLGLDQLGSVKKREAVLQPVVLSGPKQGAVSITFEQDTGSQF